MQNSYEEQMKDLQIKILNATQRGEVREAKYWAKELKKLTEKHNKELKK